jgi:hypothetical protein
MIKSSPGHEIAVLFTKSLPAFRYRPPCAGGVECLGKVVGEVVEAVDKSWVYDDLATVSFAAKKE